MRHEVHLDKSGGGSFQSPKVRTGTIRRTAEL